MKGGNTYEKITHKAVHCNADIDIYSNNEHSGKGKDQIDTDANKTQQPNATNLGQLTKVDICRLGVPHKMKHPRKVEE